MGYTHYMRQSRDLTEDEWFKICDGMRIILDTASCPLAGWDGNGDPLIDGDRVSFNGVGSDGCETAAVNRKMGELFDYEVKQGDTSKFAFCKTRERPYDLEVRRLYRLAKDVAPDAFEISSDGGDEVFEGLSIDLSE